jgi:hypothetical protein
MDGLTPVHLFLRDDLLLVPAWMSQRQLWARQYSDLLQMLHVLVLGHEEMVILDY